jgi:hypothetical protein
MQDWHYVLLALIPIVAAVTWRIRSFNTNQPCHWTYRGNLTRSGFVSEAARSDGLRVIQLTRAADWVAIEKDGQTTHLGDARDLVTATAFADLLFPVKAQVVT